MSRKHSLIQRIQESSPVTDANHASLTPQHSKDVSLQWTPMTFNVVINVSLRRGMVLFSPSFIWLLVSFGYWAFSRPTGQLSIDLSVIILVVPVSGLFMGMFFLLNGMLTKHKQVLLEKTKLVAPPYLFWKKQHIIEYQQIVDVNWGSPSRGRQTTDGTIIIKYHPLNPDKKINYEQIRTIVIKGVERENRLLFELQRRAINSKHVPARIKIQALSPEISQEIQPDKLAKEETKDYWLYFLVTITLGGFFTFFFLEGQSVWLRKQLPQSGVHTTGTVIEHRTHRIKYGMEHFITSEYAVTDPLGQTQTFTQEYFCTEEQYENFPDGSQISIIYLPQNPKISDISGNETRLVKNMWPRDTTTRLFVFIGGPLFITIIIQSIRNHVSSRKK